MTVLNFLQNQQLFCPPTGTDLNKMATPKLIEQWLFQLLKIAIKPKERVRNSTSEYLRNAL
jgi:hypothetical protein